CGHDPPQRLRRRVPGRLGAVPGQDDGERAGSYLGYEQKRDRDDDQSRRKARHLCGKLPALPRPRELWEDRDPDRLCRERDDDEAAVRGEEAVGLVRTSDLVGDHHPGEPGHAGDDEERSGSEHAPSQRAQTGRVCTLAHRRGSVRTMPNDTLWTGGTLDDLRVEFGDVYGGRTVLVTGADGFVGAHLTEALVELGAWVDAFVRATSSGALNNIAHLRSRLKIHFADLTDRTSIDYLIRELKGTVDDRPYVFHLGAQAHVGESWHRPYETVAANVLGTLNLLQAVVDW